jgi:hypothetical protein
MANLAQSLWIVVIFLDHNFDPMRGRAVPTGMRKLATDHAVAQHVTAQH